MLYLDIQDWSEWFFGLGYPFFEEEWDIDEDYEED